MNPEEAYENLLGLNQEVEAIRTPPAPKGWEPGVVWDGKKGQVTTGTLAAAPQDWSHILRERGLDPDVYEVVGDSIKWTSFDGWKRDNQGEDAYSAMCYVFRAEIRLKRAQGDPLGLEELYKEARKVRKRDVRGGEVERTLVIALSDWQVGNALSDDTPILTPSGWTKHGDIIPGDFVYGPCGTPVRVLAVTGSNEQMCYRVTFDRGESIIASGEHLWTGWRRYNTGEGQYERRRLTWTTEQIAAIKPTMRDGRRYIGRAFHVDLPAPVTFPVADLAIDPYVFGAWLGDGKRDSGWIVTADYDLKHWLTCGADVTVMPTKPHPTTSIVRVVGLTTLLRLEGVLGQKWVPEKYLHADIDQRLALLQGLMDTDGHADAKGGCEFVNTNPLLADAVEWLATSLGMKTTRTTKVPTLNGEPKTEVTIIRFTPNAALPHQQVFRMERKKARLRMRSDDQTCYRFVQGVEPVGIRSAQCLTVEGSLYLAGHGLVVTHNCDAGGHKATIEAIAAIPDLLSDQVRVLKNSGQPVQHIIVAGEGDLGEGTCGFYPSQPFLTELDRREQSRVVRRGIKDVVVTAAKSVQRVTVTCAGGNHGENRENGKRQTGFNDNDDVAAFEQVYEILRETPLDNIQWRIPRDEMAVSVEAHGQYIAFTHGHLAKPQKNAAEALWNWWASHAMGRYYQGLADANILVAGHFHHLNVKQQDKRTVMICPSLTAVGDWYSNSAGVQTVPGTLTFTVDARGWDNLRILR